MQRLKSPQAYWPSLSYFLVMLVMSSVMAREVGVPLSEKVFQSTPGGNGVNGRRVR